MEEKDREHRKMVGEHQELEFESKERNREAAMLGGEREEWEDGKIEAIMDIGYRGNLCGLI